MEVKILSFNQLHIVRLEKLYKFPKFGKWFYKLGICIGFRLSAYFSNGLLFTLPRVSIYFVCLISLHVWIGLSSSFFTRKQSIYLGICHSFEVCCVHIIFIIMHRVIEVHESVLSNCSEGGFFNAIMSFPNNYPNSPPTVKFTSEIWHPNGWFLS